MDAKQFRPFFAVNKMSEDEEPEFTEVYLGRVFACESFLPCVTSPAFHYGQWKLQQGKNEQLCRCCKG